MSFSAEDIKKLGPILGVWAHPDDESWCAAGVLATALKNGQRVACITATRGEGSQTADEHRWPQARLAEIRSAELADALDVLGIKEHYWLSGFADGKLKDSDHQSAVEELVRLIKLTRPNTILTFGADGLTGHDDHKTVYEWSRRALKMAESSAEIYCVSETSEKYSKVPGSLHDSIYFNTAHPKLVDASKADMLFVLPEDIKSLKLKALQAQPCQMNVFFKNPEGRAYLEEVAKTEAFMKDV